MKKKIYFILIICLLLAFYLPAAATTNDDFAMITTENLSGQSDIVIVLDHVTGVEYLVYYDKMIGEVGVCPRYNEDGSLFNIRDEEDEY